MNQEQLNLPPRDEVPFRRQMSLNLFGELPFQNYMEAYRQSSAMERQGSNTMVNPDVDEENERTTQGAMQRFINNDPVSSRPHCDMLHS